MSYELAPCEMVKTCKICNRLKPESRFLKIVKEESLRGRCDVCRKKVAVPKVPTSPRRSIEDRNALVQNNLRLAWHVVKGCMRQNPYMRTGAEDLFQEAVIALIAAASAWDETRGILFSSYACRAMRNRILLEEREGGIISVPQEKQVLPKYAVLRCVKLLSECALEIKANDSKPGSWATLPDESSIDKQDADTVMSRLPSEDREYLEAYYYENKSYQNIADEKSVSQSSVRNRIGRIISSLQEEFV